MKYVRVSRILPDTADEKKSVGVFHAYPTQFTTPLSIDVMNTAPHIPGGEGAADDVLMEKGVSAEKPHSCIIWTITTTKNHPYLPATCKDHIDSKSWCSIFSLIQACNNKFTAAYPTGYTISEFELAQYPQLKATVGETDTRVLVTYNTQRRNISGKNTIAMPGAIGINPARTGKPMKPVRETCANASHNGGAVFFYNNVSTAKIPVFTSISCEGELCAKIGSMKHLFLQPASNRI